MSFGQLSESTLVIIFFLILMTVCLVFIFGKRQIMRFAIRSRRGPHVPIGHDAKKSLRREIDRRIEAIPKIVHEPKLLHNDQDDGQPKIVPGTQLISTYYRLKAVDDVKPLEKELGINRTPPESLRGALVTALCGPSEPLTGPAQKIVHQFCDLYEHARHGAADFGEVEYQAYVNLHKKLMEAGKQTRSHSMSHKSSPSRTPVRRQTRLQSSLPLADLHHSEQNNETRV